MQTFITLIISLLAAILLFGIFVLITNFFYASKGYKGKVSDHFDGKRFYNIGWSAKESMRIERFEGQKGGFIYWLLHREKTKWKKRNITPIVPEPRNTNGVRITNIGHATYLIQIGGLNILTDPVWGKRASPWQWIGPKRYQDPGVKLENLPKIDIVLLSHNHYDHMEISTLRYLSERDNPTIYTGLGNKAYLNDRSVEHVVEMDWWEDQSWKENNTEATITFLPAQHFSARGVTDRNITLWGAFVFTSSGKSLYFGGDTGYGVELMHTVHEKFPNGLDIGLIPIGAYKPRWFMAPVHTDPFEGMQMQRDLGIKKAIGIHHSTFDLADDNQDDPVIDLTEAKKREEYQGQIFEIGDAGTVWKW